MHDCRIIAQKYSSEMLQVLSLVKKLEPELFNRHLVAFALSNFNEDRHHVEKLINSYHLIEIIKVTPLLDYQRRHHHPIPLRFFFVIQNLVAIHVKHVEHLAEVVFCLAITE